MQAPIRCNHASSEHPPYDGHPTMLIYLTLDPPQVSSTFANTSLADPSPPKVGIPHPNRYRSLVADAQDSLSPPHRSAAQYSPPLPPRTRVHRCTVEPPRTQLHRRKVASPKTWRRPRCRRPVLSTAAAQDWSPLSRSSENLAMLSKICYLRHTALL
jgi:hypothetical protein